MQSPLRGQMSPLPRCAFYAVGAPRIMCVRCRVVHSATWLEVAVAAPAAMRLPLRVGRCALRAVHFARYIAVACFHIGFVGWLLINGLVCDRAYWLAGRGESLPRTREGFEFPRSFADTARLCVFLLHGHAHAETDLYVQKKTARKTGCGNGPLVLLVALPVPAKLPFFARLRALHPAR
jgi:hypothetical protein